MTATRRVLILATALLSTVAMTGATAQAQAQGPVAHSACGMGQRIDQRSAGGERVYSRPNSFDTSGQRLCISGSRTHPGFKITTNLRFTGKWQAYPFTGYGCAFLLCSPGTDLPKRVRALPRTMNTSFSWHGPARGNWNASYDVWFDHHDQIRRQDNGDELMIWLRSNPGYRGGQLVRVGKHRFWFKAWKTCDRAKICWNYTQFRFPHTVHSVHRLWLRPFLRFLEKRGLVRRSWWLTSVHAGYELVSGGKGLTTTWFNVRK